jgi:hypothetical protein
MRPAHARPEQTHIPKSLTQIINDALRDAALSPTPNGAIDVLGGALQRLAELARVEGIHA